MICRNCKRLLPGKVDTACPHCGEPIPAKLSGVLKTSTILISADQTDAVYRSVREVPEPLRKKLLRSTHSLNARTILIADRRGRQQLARALEKLSGARERRRSGRVPGGSFRFSTAPLVGMLLAGAGGLLVWLILAHNW